MIYIILGDSNGNNKEKFDASLYFNKYVRTNKDSEIYIKEDGNYIKVGMVATSVDLVLNEITNIEEEYFSIDEFEEEYYIFYKDVEKIDNLSEIDQRYKRYIVFNYNVVTQLVTNFYDEFGNLVYSIDKGFSLPVVIIEDDMYGVEFNNRLLYIKKNESSIIDNHNTDSKNTPGIGVLNYHFFYDETNQDDAEKCNQEICTSMKQFREHLDYIKNNNFFTPTMKELEMYIDNKIQLPKSVVITIDDGWRSKLGIELLNDYELNGTLFLITAYYDPENYRSEYVELHSHTDNMHTAGQCPGGQGGGLKCLPEEEILADLEASREKLGGSTVLCYPFYEYNDYTIRVAKEAGFTMAFTGESTYSDNLVKVGSDKFRLPRFVIVNYTTMTDLANYLNQYQ